MLQIRGDYFDGQNSQKVAVMVVLNSDGGIYVSRQTDGEEILSLDQQQVEISSRLGNSPRYLSCADGQSIETLENDLVDQWVKQSRPRFLYGLVNRLESNLRFVVLTVIMVSLIMWLALQFGVPAVSHGIAKALPPELLDRASEETLQIMDSLVMEPSELSQQRQHQLQQHFAEAIQSHEDLRIQVAFRKSDEMGANAFALPNGQIIFTDEIVALAEHDDELLAILAHEIGHVKYRHGMRRIVQNSLFVFVIAMITGDASGTSEIVLGLPVLFAELAYSRAHETESDQYALEFLKQRQIPTQRFSDIMLRLEASFREEEETHKERDSRWQHYLSTHPLTSERIKAFQ